MRFLTVEQMRAADRAAVDERGIPEQVLMNRAGVALARCVKRFARLREIGRIILVAGHGNNGGDACVAASCLHTDGFNVHVIMTCIPSRLKGAAHNAWEEMQSMGVAFEVAASEESWRESFRLCSGALVNYGIVVDGVLGTGCEGVPRGAAAEAIRWINSIRPYSLVIAADIPSGMNGDTGVADGDVVKADVTVTFAAPKRGFCNPEAMRLLGHLVVADIGIPDEIAFRHHAQTDYQLVSRPELVRAYSQRAWDANKGSYGHLCVIGGIGRYPNAPVLCCAGALRSGAGLVTLRSCCGLSGCALSLVPESVVEVLSPDDFYLADEGERKKLCPLESFNAIVAGPGLGRTEGATALVRHLIENFEGTLVLDADALNVLAALRKEGYPVRDDRRLLITPHPGEAARLLDCPVGEVQNNRVTAVQELARRYHAVAVLKGAGTLISDGQSMPWLNLTGNPGMATGGTGDVLAGIIGGLLAQGIDSMQAAALAVWVHGSAGDLAWIKGSQTSLTATDLIAMLPRVYQEIER